jgi:hypothetical protein
VQGELGRRLRRVPSILALARVLAWGAGYGAAFLVAYTYPELPDELPLSRWTVAPKSMFFALRVPLINLATIGLCELLARALRRAPDDQQKFAELAGAALLSTAGAKALLGALAIVRLPDANPAHSVVSLVVVATGLSLAAWFARPLLAGAGVRGLRSTRLEQVLGALLLVALVVLNLPLAAPGLFQ